MDRFLQVSIGSFNVTKIELKTIQEVLIWKKHLVHKHMKRREKLICTALNINDCFEVLLFPETRLLQRSDWMTQITCLESPMIINSWQKKKVYLKRWVRIMFQFLFFRSHVSSGGVWLESLLRRCQLWSLRLLHTGHSHHFPPMESAFSWSGCYM